MGFLLDELVKFYIEVEQGLKLKSLTLVSNSRWFD